MKPVIDTYFGSPLEHASEKEFLERLTTDLLSHGESAFIFANFHTGKNSLQVDFFVVTSKCACHIELKNYTAPVVGSIDGPWKLITPSGELKVDRNKNPYHQALNCKYSISDAMHKMAERDPRRFPAVKGRKFYSLIESAICVFPRLVSGSRISTDNKVRTKSYEDLLKFLLTHERNPGWNRDHWRQLAMYLGLAKAESFEPEPDDRLSSGPRSLNDYRESFANFQSSDLHELVNTPIADDSGSINLEGFFDAFRNGSNILLSGPPGSGKTHLARHAAIKLAGERLPIFLRSRDFDGDLIRLIGRSIAHAYPFAASEFLHNITELNAKAVLIVDGLNECSRELKQTLISAMLAFVQEFHPAILITSQIKESLPAALCGLNLRMADLSAEEKRAVFNSYLAQGVTLSNLDDLLKQFNTPYELSIAADCASVLKQHVNHATLFDAFARRHLAFTQSLAVSFKILGDIAQVMSERFINSLTISEFQRISDAIAEEQKVSVAITDQLLACGLIDSVQGRCAFKHELLGVFFEANAFVRRWQDSGDLPVELSRPRNRRLAEFVIASLSETDLIRECFCKCPDPSLLVSALRGSLGYYAKPVALEDAMRLLKLARVDAANTRAIAVAGSSLMIDGLFSPSEYGASLLRAIGIVLHDGMFLDEVTELIETVESHCWKMAEKAAPNDLARSLAYKSNLFRQLYIVVPKGGPECFPISFLVEGFKNSRWSAKNDRFRTLFIEEVEAIGEQPFGLLYLFCEAARYSHDKAVHPILPHLFRACWQSKFLRLEILDLLNSFASDLRDSEVGAELEELLLPLESNNFFLNSSLIETKVLYGILTPEITVKAVLSSFREILATPDDPAARQRAHSELTCIFEYVFEDVYVEAYNSLSSDEKRRLLVMAALGSEANVFLTDWMLRELLDLEHSEALPAFERWATEFNDDCSCPQDSVACYLLGVMGCAKHLDSPPRFRSLPNNNHRVWQIYGEILFWVFKPGLTEVEITKRCEPLWESLVTDFIAEAVDPLMQMTSADWKLKKDERHPFGDLCLRFESQMRTVLEYALSHPSLPTIFVDPRGVMFRERHMDFVIKSLGELGDGRSAKLLETLIESDKYGKLAVEAIRQIRCRP